MSAQDTRRFVFLDRDGTLVRDPGYVHRLEDFALLPGVVEGLLALGAAGFAFAIVTNQSGIGRGHFTEADFARFQRHLLERLAGAGIRIEGTFHCPHRPDAGCGCRKPAPGLLWRARDELGAGLARSWLVGDAASDVAAAQRAGCAGAVRLAADADPSAAVTDGVAAARDLVEAARLILAAEAAPRT